MSKKTTAPAAGQPEPGQFKLTLVEFCTRLSATDSRVSLIGGFHAVEKAAGRNKDTEVAYLERFESFVKQPA